MPKKQKQRQSKFFKSQYFYGLNMQRVHQNSKLITIHAEHQSDAEEYN